jgi:hypothetical protein
LAGNKHAADLVIERIQRRDLGAVDYIFFGHGGGLHQGVVNVRSGPIAADPTKLAAP